jgi:tetratricopeptide (TPR) repeat protein
MRKINGKLFLGLLLGAGALAAAIFVVHLFQYQRIAAALLWQARRAEEQGQTERMTRFLSRYLEFNPHDDAEKAHLAAAWAGPGFANAPRLRNRAVRLLDEVLAHDGDRPDLRRLLIETALEVGGSANLKLARGHLEKLLPWEQVLQAAAGPATEDRERGELEGFWGQLLEAEDRPEEAMACCRLAVRHAPDAQAPCVRLAYLLRRHKETDPEKQANNRREADALLDALVRGNGTSHRAFLARWRYRRDFDLLDLRPGEQPAAAAAEPAGRGRNDARGRVTLALAQQDVAEALKRAPEDVDVLLAAADLERLLGQAAFDDSKLEAAQRDKEVQEHRELAYEYLQHGLKLHESLPARMASLAAHFQLLWHKAGLLLDDLQRADASRPGDPALPAEEVVRGWETEAARTIEQLRRTRVSPGGANYLQGRLLVHQRRWAEAASLFEQARTLLGHQADLANQINLNLGRCYEQLEEPSQMLSAYQRVAEKDGDSVAAVLGMAAAEWSMQRYDEAVKKYQQLILRQRMPDKCWQDLARLEIQRQSQQDKPDWAAAEATLKAAGRATPNAVEVALLEAEMWVARGEHARAAEVIGKARDKWPGEAEVWAAEADLALRRRGGDLPRAKRVLDEAREKVGDGVILRLARSRWLAAQLKRDGADRAALLREVDALADGADKFSESDRGRLLGGLAYIHLQADDPAGARVLWRKVADLPLYRTDLRLRMLLFDLAVKTDDAAGMEQALADIRAVERREGTFVQYGRALRLLWVLRKKKEKGEPPGPELAEARLLLGQVLAQRPNWPAVYLARSRVHELDGNPELAVKDLREAMHNGDTSPETVRRLAQLLVDRGRYDEARQELSKVRETLLDSDSDLGRLRARVALGLQQFDQAVKVVQGLRLDETKARELLFKGSVLAESGKVQEAEECFRRATEAAPEEPVAWVSRVQFLTLQKRPADAEAVGAEAESRVPAEKRRLTRAQCWEVMGNREKARQAYRKAEEERPRDAAVVRAAANFHLAAGRPAEAEPLLRRLFNGAVEPATAGDRDWSRHGLALVLAGSADARRFREALELEGLRLDEHGGVLPLEGQQDRSLSSEQRKSQARVLAAQLGQRQCRRRAIELFEALDRDKALLPADRYLLAVVYQADGADRKALAILSELVKVREPSPQHVARCAGLLLGQGRAAEAEKWIEQLEQMESERGVEPNTFAAVELRARLLEAQGKGSRAVALLTRHAEREKARPEEMLLVLDAYRRQKRAAEAYALCERMWQEKKCRPEVCSGASVAVLRLMGGSEEQMQRLEKRLKEAIAVKPSSLLLLHLADLYDLRGRYAEAEKLYARILEENNEPNNAVALNNRAWLLAHREGGAAEALAAIQKAIDVVGRRADLLDTRGLVYLKLGKPDPALADLKEATAEAATPTRLFHLAKAYRDTNDSTRARQAIEQARALMKASGKPLPSAMHPTEQEECRRLLAELKIP